VEVESMMLRNFRPVLLRWAACSVMPLVVTSSALAQSTDRIRTASGSESGEVTKMSPVAVTIEQGGETIDVPVTEIRSIIFRGEPAELTQARLNATNGGYEAALNRLEAINLDNIREDYVKQEVEYYTAYCKAKLSLVDPTSIREAGTELNSFVNDYPQNYHYLEATELLGDLLVNMGNFNAAQAKYQQLGKAPWPEYKMRAAVLVGQAQLAQKNYQDALQQFNSALEIEDDSPGSKAQRLAAELGKAVAAAATGNVDSGLQAVEQVIRDADPENAELLAQAYNALGACYNQSGQPKNALYAYLHTDLLYGRVAEEHAEALAQLVPLWESIGQEGEARRARQTLLEQYPASRWAQQLDQ
jgi:tetratricopeptide (TPR) repeat protein